MLEKLNLIFNSVKNSLVTEAVIAKDIRNLLDNIREREEDKNKKELYDFLHRIVRIYLYSDIKATKWATEKNLSLYFDKLVADGYEGKIIDILKEFVSQYVTDQSDKVEILLTLDDIAELKRDSRIYSFKIDKKLPQTAVKILSKINAGELTDSDIIIFHAENFKQYNRKMRREYNLMLAFFKNTLVGTANFDEVGNIYYVESRPYTHEKITLNQLLNNADQIICVKSDAHSNANKKLNERIINKKYSITDVEKKDEWTRRQNISRYRDKLWEKKKNNVESALINDLKLKMEFAKSVGLQAKQFIKDEDLFEDTELTSLFNNLISYYKQANEYIKNGVHWGEENKIKKTISYLNSAATKLESKIGDMEDELQ